MSPVRSRSGGTRIGIDGQPVEEIAPERSVLDLHLEILVGRGDEADVDLHRSLGADRGHPLFLDDPQKLGLERQRHLADLVEEQRAAVRHLEQAAPALAGARERALAEPEQLGLEQLGRDGRAVHGDERLVAPGAREVDRAGEELLADPGLAVDQHRRVELGHRAQQLEHLLHRLALRHDVLEGEPLLVPAERGAAGRAQLLELDRVADDDEQLGRLRTA